MSVSASKVSMAFLQDQIVKGYSQRQNSARQTQLTEVCEIDFYI